MFYKIFILFVFSLVGSAHAQQPNNDKIQAQVNEILKTIDWGGLDRYSQINNRLKVLENKPNAVFMGNSITEGWSMTLPDFFSENNFINRGIGGQTTPQMLIRFRQDVINLKPKSVVILAGINDIANNTKFYSIEVIAENIFSMVELAKANGITPIICSVLPADKFGWNPNILPADSVVKLNLLLKTYAVQNEVLYLNYYDKMNNEKGGLKDEFTNDGVHVTKKGYELMSKLSKEFVSNAIK
ncbi:MAG: GDSL-type esterase/lipase family protein [Flavobacteriaceae bacterium]|jgi:lysophospholipase L1-like esterase|nr:GDSL-type esterase/lipase family protein [Flavobacteriaceae bacterium]